MRALALAAVALLAACTAAPRVTEPTPTPTREPNTIGVALLLDLSGTRAALGQSQRNAAQLWLDQQQSRAGAVRIRAKFVDVAGSETRLLLELRRAAVDDRADAVVVGVPVVLDDALGAAIGLAAVPVLLTLPTTEPGPRGGGWVFALAPTVSDVAVVQVAEMLRRGPLAPAVLVEDGSRAALVEEQALRAAIASAAPGDAPPERVALASPGTADRFRLLPATARTIALTGPTSGYLDLLRAMRTDPARQLHLSYLTETAELADLRGVAGLVTAPGSRHLVPGTAGEPPERASFIRTYSERHGAPSTIAASAYDALGLLDAAAEAAPAELEPGRLRQALEARTFAGIVTRYVFSPSRRTGFDPSDLVVLAPDARGVPAVAPSPSPSPSPTASPTASPSPTATGRP